MNDITITCPKCGAEVPLSEAVSHRIRDQLARDFDQKRRENEGALAAREQKLHESQSALEQQQRFLDDEVERRLTAQRQQLLAEARQQVQEKFALDMRDLEARLTEQKQQLDAARNAELDLRKKQRQLEEQKQSLELEVARTLDIERNKIREGAQKAATEAERFKLAEKEKVIGDLQREIQNLKQKAEQGSMQLQGEVLELDLESRLRQQFATDSIEEVVKGQRGADVLQRVHTNTGHDCGAILWEAKRAKNWNGNWIAKLKEDQRAAKADLAVLVSQTLPPDVRGFGLVDVVWVCDFVTVIPLAVALRQGLITAAVARQAEVGRQGKMEQLYQFLTSVEFRQRIEGVVEAFKTMREDLEAEKRALQKHWARREKQLEQALTHTAMLYGGVQGIVGQNALPDIAPLQLPSPEENRPVGAESTLL
jgi:hypothetical protein